MASTGQNSNNDQMPVVTRSAGLTASERYLKGLCDRSFLSLWSYPGVFRDQGRQNGKGVGKEVCDLLVVFENHVIIFSDKYCEFQDTGNLELDWARWYRKTVQKSAEQVWGAERWLRSFPNRLFLDPACSVPFPLELPRLNDATFHRIVVAHDASRRCRERMGGSGSLMLDSSLIGVESHLRKPFTIGFVDEGRSYVHVFDDTSLDVVLRTLDTASDFVAYLTKKEHLMASGMHILATGEEELLAEYLSKLNSEGEHDFIFPRNLDGIFLPEGHWAEFLNSPERRAQVEANRVSYVWDALIETFLGHLMGGTQYWASHRQISEQEKSFRWLARENRTRRRMLANALGGLMEKTPHDYRASRMLRPSRLGDPYYIFLLLPCYESIPEAQYREARRNLLEAYCRVLKLKFPDASHVIGIATESGRTDYGSEDFLHFDLTNWNEELEADARSLQRDLKIFYNVKVFAGREQEYPVDRAPFQDTYISRNAICPWCDSRKRFKRCCGAKMVGKKRRP
jgi:hypothetical protein